MPWDQLLGPLGLLAGSLMAVVVLWRMLTDRQKRDVGAQDALIAELSASRDRWRSLAESYDGKFDQLIDTQRILPSMAATLERIERRLED